MFGLEKILISKTLGNKEVIIDYVKPSPKPATG